MKPPEFRKGSSRKTGTRRLETMARARPAIPMGLGVGRWALGVRQGHDRVDFHLRSLWKRFDADGHSRGWLGLEVCFVYLVYLVERFHVGQVDRQSDGVGERCTCRGADHGEVFQALPRLIGGG